jgi:2'-5' RNA ligase
MPRANLHVTLAFLGPLTAADLAKVLALTPPLTAPFELVLDQLGLWERAQVLWAGPTGIPEPLTRLEAGLWDALVAIGFERERRAYRPHLTIARKARAARGTLVPVRWSVGDIALVESRPGPRRSRYETLKTWALSAGA